MNLRGHLKEILPEILPDSPTEAIKGTELIRLVKFRLHQDYSDATLRYHFSIMCCDPASPIAKVEQGQGYYLRTHTVNSFYHRKGIVTPSQPSLGQHLFEQPPAAVDLAIARAKKFRAAFERLAEASGQFPFPFERAYREGAPLENVWRYPDLALVDWLAMRSDDSPQLDVHSFRVRQALGQQPFRITAVKLRMEVTYRSVHEDFYQALSHSGWAHAGELMIAAPISDEQLADQLRRLGAEHGVGITTFGLAPEAIDELPQADAIRAMQGRELDALQSRMNVVKLNVSRPRACANWNDGARNGADDPDFRALTAWLAHCIERARPLAFSAYRRSLAPAAR